VVTGAATWITAVVFLAASVVILFLMVVIRYRDGVAASDLYGDGKAAANGEGEKEEKRTSIRLVE